MMQTCERTYIPTYINKTTLHEIELVRPGIKSYNDGFCFKISIQVFYIFYQKSLTIYLGQTF